MGTLYITEFGNCGDDRRGRQVQAALQPVIAEQAVTTSATSAQSAALNSATALVRLQASTDVSILFGVDPTATAAKMRLTAGAPEYFSVTPGLSLKIAAIE